MAPSTSRQQQRRHRAWPDKADLEACSLLIKENGDGYRDWLGGMSEEQLNQPITYRSQSGEPFKTPARDIVTHVALHGQYHRGQINALLREDGATPAGVDYILYSRLGGASASE